MTNADQDARRPAPGEYRVVFDESGVAEVSGAGFKRSTQVRTTILDHRISLAFGRTLPAELADMLDIATAAYVADRLCVRRVHGVSRAVADELWQRRITIQVPLRRPDAWNSTRRTNAEVLLAFLSDDQWSLEFTEERPQLRPSEAQGVLFETIPTGDVSAGLLSGGLDSMAGIVATLAGHPSRTVIALSVRTNNRIGAYQREQVERLNAIFGDRVLHVPVDVRLNHRDRGAYDREESSQRTRAFVFQVFGAVAAAVAECDLLQVFENGVGALNLPFSAAQLGAQATRATNPIAIGLAGDMMSEVVGREYRFELPHRFATKAEMCGVFQDQRLRSLASLTISCDRFPQRVEGQPQCGMCPSCLFSRQSLFTAGLRDVDDSSRYRHDIYEPSARKHTALGYDFRLMTAQAAAVGRLVEAPHAWPHFAAKYPLLVDVRRDHTMRTSVDPSTQIISLFQRYGREWAAFWTEIVQPSAVTV